MKKTILIVGLLLAAGAALFCQPIDSKKGYLNLPWGSTVKDAEKAGYVLMQDTNGLMDNLWLDKTELYLAVPKEKDVLAVLLCYYKGKLFFVNEKIRMQSAQSKLEARYGNFKKSGIYKNEDKYVDWVVNNEGKLKFYSIMICPKSDGTVSTTMQDWDVFRMLNKDIQQYVAMSGSLVDSFKLVANKLVPAGGNKVSTYAILKFSSDFKNVQYDEYIADALTEAIFNTGSVKIIERGNLEKIIKEQKLQASGLIDERTAKAVGKISGADYVCFGSVKDVGQKFAISARVVDVETGEICAMSRDTIEKDEYLLGSSGGASNSNSSASSNSASGKPVKTAWTVTKNRNDFDGYTEFIFTLLGADDRRCVVIYQRNDDKYKSKLISGIIARFDEADVKVDNGSVTTIKSVSNYYYKENGKEYRLDIEDEKRSGRNWLKLFMNNNHIVFRARDIVTHFETAGLLSKMESEGITWSELDRAMKNQEF